MGLTDSRKTAKNLVDSRKNWKILTVSRKYSKKELRGSLAKSGPLDFATTNTFPLFFVGEEALVRIY